MKTRTIRILIIVFTVALILFGLNYGTRINPKIIIIEDEQINEYEGLPFNNTLGILIYENETNSEEFNKNFRFRPSNNKPFREVGHIYAKPSPSNESLFVADANPGQASKSNDPSLIFFDSEFSNIKRYPLPKLRESNDRNLYYISHYNWVGDNIFLSARVFHVGLDHYYIFNTKSEEYKELRFTTGFDDQITGTLGSPNSQYFLIHYCSNEKVWSGGCQQRVFALSDSKTVKKIIKKDVNSFEWGWKEDKIFIKEYTFDSSKITKGIEAFEKSLEERSKERQDARTYLRVFLIDPEKVM